MLGGNQFIDQEYVLKIKVCNIQYHNWEDIFTSQNYTIDVKQLKDFTFDYPDTIAK